MSFCSCALMFDDIFSTIINLVTNTVIILSPIFVEYLLSFSWLDQSCNSVIALSSILYYLILPFHALMTPIIMTVVLFVYIWLTGKNVLNTLFWCSACTPDHLAAEWLASTRISVSYCYQAYSAAGIIHIQHVLLICFWYPLFKL